MEQNVAPELWRDHRKAPLEPRQLHSLKAFRDAANRGFEPSEVYQQGVPEGVPEGVRAGSRRWNGHCFCMLFPRPNLGVPGTLSAMLRDSRLLCCGVLVDCGLLRAPTISTCNGRTVHATLPP